MHTVPISNQELLSRLIGPRKTHQLYQGSLAKLLFSEEAEGTRPEELSAAWELVRRALEEELRARSVLSKLSDVYDFLRLTFAGRTQEAFVVLYLDATHRLIEAKELFRGTLNIAGAYPREVVKYALIKNAASVILAHNHPSGVAEPSTDDLILTRRFNEALALVGAKVLDHIVIGGNTCMSFADRGLINGLTR